MVKTVRDFDFSGKKVLVRSDLDVPREGDEIIDDFRLRTAIPTLKYILGQCEQLIIIGHSGRPGGEEKEELSLEPVAERMQELLGKEITFVEDCIQDELPDDHVLLLENLRFHEEERNGDPGFAKKLSSYCEIYVNEAFAVSHRSHASITGIPEYVPGCIGLQFEREMKYLNLDSPDRPLVALIGGAKLETKIPVIRKLLRKVDRLLLGGAMMFTFYKAKGYEIGESLYQEDFVVDARTLMNNEKLVLPSDVAVADSKDSAEGEVVDADSMPADKLGLDLGPETVDDFKELLKKARTIVWNGPLGYNENEEFAKATNEIAEYLADIPGAQTIIGGGDTASVVNKLGLQNKYTHVSTGGGASLKLLEGAELPAIKALKE